MNPHNLDQAPAAAELYVRSLERIAHIDSAWRKPESSVACATTSGCGPHLSNLARDFDADVHLICETDGVDSAGNLPEDTDREDHGDIYFNVSVRGIADDLSGYGLVTHVPMKDEAHVKEGMEPELRRLAQAAGVPLA
jgi:hypothetical protein